MKELLPLTPEQLARAEELLRNPPPGSRIEAARNCGIDLSLMLRQLKLTPEERVRSMHAAAATDLGDSALRARQCLPESADLAELEALAEIYARITPSHTAH